MRALDSYTFIMASWLFSIDSPNLQKSRGSIITPRKLILNIPYMQPYCLLHFNIQIRSLLSNTNYQSLCLYFHLCPTHHVISFMHPCKHLVNANIHGGFIVSPIRALCIHIFHLALQLMITGTFCISFRQFCLSCL